MKRKKKRNFPQKKLIVLAQKATQRAWNENFALGLPIVIEENGSIIKKYKDGKTEVIKKINKQRD